MHITCYVQLRYWVTNTDACLRNCQAENTANARFFFRVKLPVVISLVNLFTETLVPLMRRKPRMCFCVVFEAVCSLFHKSAIILKTFRFCTDNLKPQIQSQFTDPTVL